MKRIITVLLLVISLFAICSCTFDRNICYYAYFQDTAFVLVYSRDKNTLYEINVPPQTISLWGRSQNIATIAEAMRSFAELKDSGFMVGTSQTLDAIREILNAMSPAKNPTAQDRLAVVSSRASDFASAELLSKMNSLCGTDMSALVNVLKKTRAKVSILDSSSVVKSDDPQFSQKYFKKYINQVINK